MMGEGAIVVARRGPWLHIITLDEREHQVFIMNCINATSDSISNFYIF